MAQLFGLSQPPASLAALPPAPAHGDEDGAGHGGGRPTAASLAPVLRGLAEREFGLSGSRLAPLIDEAASNNRSLEWLTSAIRATSIRGVLQTRIDAFADEVAALGRQPV